MIECPRCKGPVSMKKICGKEYVVVGGRSEFAPSILTNKKFVSLKGVVQTGLSVPDGIKGYQLHECIEK